MRGKLLGVLAALAIGTATTALAAGRGFGGGMRSFGVPHIGGGFGAPRVGGGFGAPHVGGGFSSPRLGGSFETPHVGGGFAAPHLGGGFRAPPPGGGFGAPRVGGDFTGPRLGGHGGTFPPGGRHPGEPVLGNPGLRHYTFRHHHHRFRPFIYAPVGLGWPYYDGCWRRAWTLDGWSWTNICYGYPAVSGKTARRSCAIASKTLVSRHCKPGRRAKGVSHYRRGSRSKG